MVIVTNLSDWLHVILGNIRCREETKAYVVSVFEKQKMITNTDLHNKSIVLAYSEAIENFQFSSFQMIGDLALWKLSMNTHLDDAQIIQVIGKKSYHTCHNMLQKQWVLYEELALNLPKITQDVNHRLTQF